MTDPVLIDIPMPIQTRRLIMRHSLPGDGPVLAAAINESYEELREWMPWVQNRPTDDEQEANVRRAHAQWILREDLRINLYDKKSAEFLGCSGFHRMKWDVPRLEIGYWVRKKYEGQGYITEAVAALTKFAFEALGAKRLEIRCDAENTRSKAIPERLGYQLEATLRNDMIKPFGTELRDTLLYTRFDAQNIMDVGATW